MHMPSDMYILLSVSIAIKGFDSNFIAILCVFLNENIAFQANYYRRYSTNFCFNCAGVQDTCRVGGKLYINGSY